MNKFPANSTAANSSFSATLHVLKAALQASGSAVRAAFRRADDGVDLPQRLRFDIGLADLNPDCGRQVRDAHARPQKLDHLRSI